MIVAFDPGRNLGVAFVTGAGELMSGQVLSPEELDSLALPDGATVLVGDGTGSRQLVARLAERGVVAELVPEEGTSLEARALYYQQNKPRGWARLVPVGMRSPGVPIDDYAAYAIALRWLRRKVATGTGAGLAG